METLAQHLELVYKDGVEVVPMGRQAECPSDLALLCHKLLGTEGIKGAALPFPPLPSPSSIILPS